MSKSNHEHITKPIASWAARAQYTIPMIITSNRQLTNPYPSAAARIIAQKEKKKEAAGPRIKTLSHHLNLHMDSNTRDEPFLPTNQPIAPNQQHRSINQHPQQSPPPTPSPPEAPNPREAARPTRKHRSHLRSTRREGGRPTASRETGGSEARSKTLEACLGGGGGGCWDSYLRRPPRRRRGGWRRRRGDSCWFGIWSFWKVPLPPAVCGGICSQTGSLQLQPPANIEGPRLFIIIII